ncbi:MAG: M48 family metalloprotease [Pseudomonadota bacterium]|nr:M48 family metalloprotease [Pseudomonadota bacterium]MDP1904990.1 M48 family metalloprotease [Pseudomonadota bacterium]MDP2351123.1 M48 family metalloprotease [Pseudomonadota bacterium]
MKRLSPPRHPISLEGPLTRRDFLWLMGAAGGAALLPLSGCAVDPVTGQKTLVGMSEQQEMSLDKSQSPNQFSSDLGAVQDAGLNRYVADVGGGLWSKSHRPKMPYSARVLNANYVNAYTFPGGSMGVTRGIMLEMQSEDELAALLGHETGHVNARHAAERAGKELLANVALTAASVAIASSENGQQYLPLLQPLSQVGASALLAKYSRDNEREADSLGMDYMVAGGYNPDGMSGLMNMLRGEARQKPSLLETMFSSHPMSEERYQTARLNAEQKYAQQRTRPPQRERYLDHTAGLRRIQPTVEACQKGEALMANKQLPQAEDQFGQALRYTRDDYAANVLMAKALMAQKKTREADNYLATAKSIYPGEAQAVHLSGLAKLALRQPEAALAEFVAYDKLLPGNPGTLFFVGAAHENMGQRREAANYYYRYLQSGAQGGEAQFAVARLKDWKVIK